MERSGVEMRGYFMHAFFSAILTFGDIDFAVPLFGRKFFIC